MGFDQCGDFSFRARYYIPFAEYGKLKGFTGKLIQVVRWVSLKVQKIIGINRLKNIDITIKKGSAYFSITEAFLQEVLKQEKFINTLFRYTLCCDEVFVQTVAFNSRFNEKIYDMKNEWDGCMREVAWPSNISGIHPGWNYSMKDLNYLLNSKRLFAMKFESIDGVDVIEAIKEARDIR